MIKFNFSNWAITIDSLSVQQFDDNTIDLAFYGDFTTGGLASFTTWKAYIKNGTNLALLDLTAFTDGTESGYKTTLDRNSLGYSGPYYVQVVGSYGIEAEGTYHERHSNRAEFIVPSSLDGNATWNPLPKVFTDALEATEKIISLFFSNTSTYAVGDYCIRADKLYRCTTAITSAAAWDDEKWTEIHVMPELSRLIASLQGQINVKVTEPLAEGTVGQVLATNGSGGRYWTDMTGGGGGGTSDYNSLDNKPKVNSVTLEGNKTLTSLGIASESDLDAVEVLIPAQATAENQLADKAFVNSSISTNTANYISNDGEPFTSVAQLEAYTGVVTNNDYAFVTGTDEHGNTYFDRYKATVSGTTVTWAKEYRLNNSSFTAAQWAAISSGITSGKVSSYDTHIANTSNPHSVTAAQTHAATIKDFTCTVPSTDWSYAVEVTDKETTVPATRVVSINSDTFVTAKSYALGNYQFDYSHTFTATTSRAELVITVTEATFRAIVAVAGTYVFTHNGTYWYRGETLIGADLTAYGITITEGTPQSGDTITIVYTETWSESGTAVNLATLGITITGNDATAIIPDAAYIKCKIVAASIFTKAVTVNGILADDKPFCDVLMDGDYSIDEGRITAWSLIYRIVATANTLTFYAEQQPNAQIPIQIRCMRGVYE